MCSQEGKRSSEEEGRKKEKERTGKRLRKRDARAKPVRKGLRIEWRWAGISGYLNLRDEDTRWCRLIFNARY